MNSVGQQMIDERLAGPPVYQQPDEFSERLARMGAANAVPPLEMSPCIKIIATGQVHFWTEFFANRPDLCVNCDETGNTDPAAWQGRTPPAYQSRPALDSGATPGDAPSMPDSAPAPSASQAGVTPGDIPTGGLAGIPANFFQAYVDKDNIPPALPIGAVQNLSGMGVSEATASMFRRQTGG